MNHHKPIITRNIIRLIPRASGEGDFRFQQMVGEDGLEVLD